MSKHERRAPFEQLRRNRLGDLWKLIENRYGSRVLPNDDAGRSDLFELLLVISLGERPAAKMQNTIETAAPWMQADEAEAEVAHITVALDRHERWCSPRELGERLNLRDCERQLYGIRHIRPIDVSDDDLIARRKARNRDRKRVLRRLEGARSRVDFLANCLSRQKPWLAQGISRRTWYRRRGTSLSAKSLSIQRTDLCQPHMASMATVSIDGGVSDAGSDTPQHREASRSPSTLTDLCQEASALTDLRHKRRPRVSLKAWVDQKKGSNHVGSIKSEKSGSPAPRSFEPALVENQSAFPGAIADRDECPGYPEMPDFLRRKPRPATEATP
jgi:hypothetical protein